MTIDRNGIANHRWVSSGGVQITGRVMVDHAMRVCEAWQARQAEAVEAGEVNLLRGPYTKRLPFRLVVGA